MDEKGEMNGRLPWQNVPRHGTREQVALSSGHYPGQHGEEAAGRDRGCAIERDRTSALADHLSRAWLTHVQALRKVAGVRVTSLVIQLDDLLLRARLPGCDHRLIEDLPLHRLVSTQPVRPSVPDVSRHIANSISGEEQRHTARPAGHGTG